MASFTFGYTDEKHQGTTVAADDLLDVSQWWSDSFAMEPLVTVCNSYQSLIRSGKLSQFLRIS